MRKLLFAVRAISILLLVFFVLSSPLSAATPERQKAQSATGKSLRGFQDGVAGVVGGFFGIFKNGAQFLYYGTRDGLSSGYRKAKQSDAHIQKKLW